MGDYKTYFEGMGRHEAEVRSADTASEVLISRTNSGTQNSIIVTLAAFQHDLGVCRNKTAQSGIDIHLFMEYLDQLQRIVGFSHDQVMSAFPAVTESRRIPPALKEKVAGFGTWRFAVGNQSQAVRQTICVFSCLGITKYRMVHSRMS